MRFAAKSDKGMLRSINEDSYDILPDLPGVPLTFIIADGMGGHNSGEVASSLAVAFSCSYIAANYSNMAEKMDTADIINKVMQETNLSVYISSREDDSNSGMGTTYIIAQVIENRLHIGHVGDSRVYLIRDGNIQRITTDHSFIEELVKNGSLTREEAANHPKKNLITRALGCEAELKTDLYVCDIMKNDYFILCTDGLSNMLEDEEIKRLVLESDDPGLACGLLVNKANENGGEDNITVIVLKND